MSTKQMKVIKRHLVALAEGRPMPALVDPASRDLIEALGLALRGQDASGVVHLAQLGVFACSLLSKHLEATLIAERELNIFFDSSGRRC